MRSMRIALRTLAVLAFAGTTGSAFGQRFVTLPNSDSQTTFHAHVSEQCRITVPANVHFWVGNIANPTDATPKTVTIDNIVLADGHRLELSILAESADFAPPVPGTMTWKAADISWAAPTWTGGATSPVGGGTLSDSTAAVVGTSAVNQATMMQTDNLVFTLAPDYVGQRTGDHTLVAHWTVSSVTP